MSRIVCYGKAKALTVAGSRDIVACIMGYIPALDGTRSDSAWELAALGVSYRHNGYLKKRDVMDLTGATRAVPLAVEMYAEPREAVC